jgi:hypothetical protein
MKLSEKESQFLREARPWMVIAGVGSFIYCLIRFEDVFVAVVGLGIGVASALGVVRFHRGPKKYE